MKNWIGCKKFVYVEELNIVNLGNGSYLQELIDVEGDGMADMVFHCIQEMDIDNRMMVLIVFYTVPFRSCY